MIGFQLVALTVVVASAGLCVWIGWRSTDPDPASGRAILTPTEQQSASERLQWIETELLDLAKRSGVPALRPPQFANFGAYYMPLGHQVRVSCAMCAKLDDEDLRLILAHEVGHAARRWRTLLVFTDTSALREEVLADRFSMAVTGASEEGWLKAVSNSQAMEPGGCVRQLHFRAQELGLALPV